MSSAVNSPKPPPDSAAVTVVVSTFNRAQWLQQCLGSLLVQLEGCSGVRVLVVDNHSTDRTAQVVEQLAARWTALSYVHEPRQGRSHAKNRGIAEAGTDWIAFLDDDARVLPGYVDELLRLTGDGQFDVVGGLYVPWYAEGKVAWFRDEYASNAGVARQPGPLPPTSFASAGVMLVRRAMLEKVAGFDPRLGGGGCQMGYGEETRLQLAVRSAGGRIGFAPAWRIEHLTPRDKQRVGWLIARGWRIGRDSWHTFDRAPSLTALLKLLPRLLTRPLGGLRRELCEAPTPPSPQSLVVAAGEPLARTAGELWGGIRGLCGGS